MTAAARILFSCTLALLLVPAHAQTRKSFDAWAVVCSGGATGYCTASNRLKSVSGPYRFQLNVTRERPGAAFELALLTGYQHPADSTAIVIQVDGNKPIKLSPREGYRRAGRSNSYVIATNQAEQLLKQMRSGKRMRFRFEDAKGAAIDTGFPLSGISAAMGFMDQMQPAPKSRDSAAVAPPAAKSPAPDEVQPPRQAAITPSAKPEPGTKPGPAAKEPARATAPPLTGQVSTPEPGAAAVGPAQPVPAPTVAEPAPAGKEIAPSRIARPAPATKDTTTAPAAATAPVAKEAAPAVATAPAPVSKEPAPAPTASAPVAKDVAPTAAPPAKQPAAAATPAPTVARAETKPKPAPTQTDQVALAPAQTPPSEPKSKPAQAQKQTAASIPPSASRKRGAKSVRQFSCRGNEPFWRFVIDGERARYSSLTDSAQPDTIELKGKLSVTGEGPTPVIDWFGKSDWGGAFRAVVTEGRCRDSMSDSEGQTEFEYLAQLSVPGGKVVRGCCNAGLPPATAAAPAPADTTQFPVADLRNRAETDWSRYLFDLLPAIQACIDKTPEPDPYATKAWPMNRGMVGVRTRNAQGGWYECVADANGKSIDRFIQLPPSAPPAPNEDRVMFSPPDHHPPGGNCFKHERVMDGMGDFMGWLSTNSCS